MNMRHTNIHFKIYVVGNVCAQANRKQCKFHKLLVELYTNQCSLQSGKKLVINFSPSKYESAFNQIALQRSRPSREFGIREIACHQVSQGNSDSNVSLFFTKMPQGQFWSFPHRQLNAFSSICHDIQCDNSNTNQ